MGDAYCISYNGLKCETDKPFLPNSSFATALMNVLEGAADTDALTRGPPTEACVFAGTAGPASSEFRSTTRADTSWSCRSTPSNSGRSLPI